MEERSSIQVVIDGNILTVGSYDNELHMQQVANCTNKIISKVKETEAYRSLPPNIKPVLIELNIADELVSAREYIAQLEEDLKLRENELSQTRQELSQALVRLDRSTQTPVGTGDGGGDSDRAGKKSGRR